MLNPEITQAMTVRELSVALEEQMREFGYAQSSLNTYRGICAKIIRYFEERGVEQFNVDLGQKFIVEYGGDQFDTTKGFKNCYRAVHMLSDLQRYGMVFKYTHVNQFEFSEGYRPLFEKFLAHIKKRGIRPLAKLSKAVKVADTSDQGKAESKAISAVAVTFRQDTKSLHEADGVLHKNALSGNLSVFPAFLFCQRVIL